MKIERIFHPNGTLESEVHSSNGIISGTSRRWFSTGQLQQEIEMLESQPSGITKQYSITGEIVDATLFCKGSGWSRTFYDDGMLDSETAFVRSAAHGPMSGFDEEGQSMIEKYFIIGKPKTKGKYEAEYFKSFASLTYVSDDEKQLASIATFVNTAPFSLSNPSDAISWLARQPKSCTRTLGECNDRHESVGFVLNALEAGALRLLINEIDHEDDGDETVNSVYFILSNIQSQRESTFTYINELEKYSGYNNTLDLQQQAVHVRVS